MEPARSLPRSPELMSIGDTGLLVVDVQERLIRLLPDHGRIRWNIGRLLEAATMFQLPRLATEQYPQGLGPTVAELGSRLERPYAKRAFSCLGSPEIVAELERLPVAKWLVVGIETHVCVQQTVLDLLAACFRVYIAIDAVGSRDATDHRTALARMDGAGATLTTTEAALFEWCQTSAAPQFKRISQMIKQTPPEHSPGPADDAGLGGSTFILT
jgi:nicotinamidase-related amidase